MVIHPQHPKVLTWAVRTQGLYFLNQIATCFLNEQRQSSCFCEQHGNLSEFKDRLDDALSHMI